MVSRCRFFLSDTQVSNKLCYKLKGYRNEPKFSNGYAMANSADPDQTALEEQSDQGLHCLPLHHLDSLLCGRAT